MASRKQEILGAIVKHGYVHFRGQFYLTWLDWIISLVTGPRRFRYNTQLANLLHRIGETTHTPEFTETDLSFLNHAVPHFLALPGNWWDLRLLELLVQLHDSAPEETKACLTWHPTQELRSMLATQKRRNEELLLQFQQRFAGSPEESTNKMLDRSGGPTGS